MILITILKSIVRKVLLSIGILLLLFTGVKVFGDDRLDTCELLLRKASEQMKTDNQLIHDLENIIEELELQLTIARTANTEPTMPDRKQTGWYVGMLSGYPFPSFNLIGMYKFRAWGIMVSTGYINGFNINAGFIIQFHE